MSITVEWDNLEHTIVRWDFDGLWNWDEVRVAQNQALVMTGNVSHVVFTILDISRSPALPGNALANIRNLNRASPANTGKIIFVGTNLFIRSILQIFQKLFPVEGSRFAFARTVEEARALLGKISHSPNADIE